MALERGPGCHGAGEGVVCGAGAIDSGEELRDLIEHLPRHVRPESVEDLYALSLPATRKEHREGLPCAPPSTTQRSNGPWAIAPSHKQAGTAPLQRQSRSGPLHHGGREGTLCCLKWFGQWDRE